MRRAWVGFCAPRMRALRIDSENAALRPRIFIRIQIRTESYSPMHGQQPFGGLRIFRKQY